MSSWIIFYTQAVKAVKEKNKELDYLYTLVNIQLWNNQIKKSITTAKEFLYDIEFIEKHSEAYQQYLLMLIAKKQYKFVYNLFTKEEYKNLQLKDRYRPIWFALMHFMKDKYPNEYRRMGSELEETVEEVIAKINQLAVDYA